MKTTISNKTILLSKQGLKDLRKSISQLEHDKQKLLQEIREIDKTYDHDGRLQRTEKLSCIESIEADLLEKRQTLANSKLMPTHRSRLYVAIGSVVELIDRQGKKFKFTIVDSIEDDHSKGKISNKSHLGKNLIGRTVRDIIEWNNGKITSYFQLVYIH